MNLHEKINKKQEIKNACRSMVITTPFERDKKLRLASLDKSIFNCFSSLFKRLKDSNNEHVTLDNEFIYRDFISVVLTCSKLKLRNDMSSLCSEISLYLY